MQSSRIIIIIMSKRLLQEAKTNQHSRIIIILITITITIATTIITIIIASKRLQQ